MPRKTESHKTHPIARTLFIIQLVILSSLVVCEVIQPGVAVLFAGLVFILSTISTIVGGNMYEAAKGDTKRHYKPFFVVSFILMMFSSFSGIVLFFLIMLAWNF